jgi:hypothetical protein
MAHTHDHHSITLTTRLPPEVADVYRRAAAASGTSVSKILRDALEDHMVATRIESEIAGHLKAGNPHAANAAYYRLAKAMMEEAIQAMTEASVLDMDILGVALDKAMKQAEAQYQADTGEPLFIPMEPAVDEGG